MAGQARRSSRRPPGRHLLRSSALAAELVREAGIGRHDLVVDLGAGTGVLTAELARRAGRVVAVEIGAPDAAALRRRLPSVQVVEGDARAVPLPAEPFRVVANLPFEGGTEILRRLLAHPELLSADVIVQWELACKRAAVWPSTALGVIWGASFELAVVRRVPSDLFAPPPSVDAGVLRARRRAEPLVPAADRDRYARFVRAGFRQGPRAVVSPLTLKSAAAELGYARNARACDLDAHHWAALFEQARGAVRRTR